MCAYLDQRSNILVLNSTLSARLVEAASVRTISHALILQVTLATLVANGAVQWVIGQQELHDAFTGLVGQRAVCLDHHAGLNRPRAGCHGLGGALDLDQAHSAVSGNHEFLVVAVAGDGGAGLFAGLDQGRASWMVVSETDQCSSTALRDDVPSTETFLPSTVSSTMLAEHRALCVKLRAAACPWARPCDRRSDRTSCCRIIFGACVRCAADVVGDGGGGGERWVCGSRCWHWEASEVEDARKAPSARLNNRAVIGRAPAPLVHSCRINSARGPSNLLFPLYSLPARFIVVSLLRPRASTQRHPTMCRRAPTSAP